MKEYITKEAMNIRVPNNRPLISATHRGSYADCLNTDKYREVTALNTVIYRKK
jgi:hypothetical protein